MFSATTRHVVLAAFAFMAGCSQSTDDDYSSALRCWDAAEFARVSVEVTEKDQSLIERGSQLARSYEERLLSAGSKAGLSEQKIRSDMAAQRDKVIQLQSKSVPEMRAFIQETGETLVKCSKKL